MYKYTIIYDGEVGKIPATVFGWGIMTEKY